MPRNEEHSDGASDCSNESELSDTGQRDEDRMSGSDDDRKDENKQGSKKGS